MELRYLLDTDICVYIHRNKPPHIHQRLRSLKQGEAALSIVTLGELLYGAMKSTKRAEILETLREFEQIVPALPLPQAAAQVYGTIRAELEATGQTIGGNDLWIAAHAKAAGLTLVTNNEREFRRVRGLKIQNWAV